MINLDRANIRHATVREMREQLEKLEAGGCGEYAVSFYHAYNTDGLTLCIQNEDFEKDIDVNHNYKFVEFMAI